MSFSKARMKNILFPLIFVSLFLFQIAFQNTTAEDTSTRFLNNSWENNDILIEFKSGQTGLWRDDFGGMGTVHSIVSQYLKVNLTTRGADKVSIASDLMSWTEMEVNYSDPKTHGDFLSWEQHILVNQGVNRLYISAENTSSGKSCLAYPDVNVTVLYTGKAPPVTGLTTNMGNVSGEIVLSWTTFNLTDQRKCGGFNIYYSRKKPDSINEMEIITSVPNGKGDRKDIQNLKPGKSYYFAVVPYNSGNDEENRDDVLFVKGKTFYEDEIYLHYYIFGFLILVITTILLILFIPGERFKKFRESSRRALRPYLYVLPAMLGLLLLTLYPFCYGFYLSFTGTTQSDLIEAEKTHDMEFDFAGLEQYGKIFNPDSFITTIPTEHTLLYGETIYALGNVDHTIIASTQTGVYYKDHQITDFKELNLPRNPDKPVKWIQPVGHEIYFANEEMIWVVDRYDFSVLSSISEADGLTVPIDCLEYLKVLDHGFLIISTAGGVEMFNLSSDRFQTRLSMDDGLISNSHKTITIHHETQVIYLGTLFDWVDRIEYPSFEPMVPLSLSQNNEKIAINSLATDFDKLYIGTTNHGILRYNLLLDIFDTPWAVDASFIENSIMEGPVSTFLLDEKAQERNYYASGLEGWVIRFSKNARPYDVGEVISKDILGNVTTSLSANGTHIFLGTDSGIIVFNKYNNTYIINEEKKVDPETKFYGVLGLTLLWTVVNIVLHVGLGLLFAIILNRKFAGRAIYRTFLLLPWAVPAYISCLIWKGMFNTEFGAVNHFLAIVGVEPIAWLSTMPWAFIAVVIVNAWLGFPFMMMTFSGGLQSIPKELYEAAEVDGVSKLTQFRTITLPLLKPTIVPATLLGFIWTFNMFNVIFLITGGGPAGQTEILITFVFDLFEQGNYSFAAAYSVIIFLMLLTFSLVFSKISKATESAY